jgi:hypothetical protein
MKRTVWTITKDHIADSKAKEGTNANARTVCGPRDCDAIFLADWADGHIGNIYHRITTHSQAIPFRMLDCDGVLYYEGYVLLGDEPEAEFIPLQDFGTPNAGATDIQYRNKDMQKWETI